MCFRSDVSAPTAPSTDARQSVLMRWCLASCVARASTVARLAFTCFTSFFRSLALGFFVHWMHGPWCLSCLTQMPRCFAARSCARAWRTRSFRARSSAGRIGAQAGRSSSAGSASWSSHMLPSSPHRGSAHSPLMQRFSVQRSPSLQSGATAHSRRQPAEQPSPSDALPSSHCSPGSTLPSPQSVLNVVTALADFPAT